MLDVIKKKNIYKNIMIKHLNSTQEQLSYINKNPAFISGFTSGEGCFTAYLGIDTSLL